MWDALLRIREVPAMQLFSSSVDAAGDQPRPVLMLVELSDDFAVVFIEVSLVGQGVSYAVQKPVDFAGLHTSQLLFVGEIYDGRRRGWKRVCILGLWGRDDLFQDPIFLLRRNLQGCRRNRLRIEHFHFFG